MLVKTFQYPLGNTIIGFSLEGNLISLSNSNILKVYFSNQSQAGICLQDLVLSNPIGEEVDFVLGECVEFTSCGDQSACNYFDYEFTCDVVVIMDKSFG